MTYTHLFHVNHPPAATEDSYSLDMNASLDIPADAGVLANDGDTDGDPLTSVLVLAPTSGTLSLNADGGFAYTPATGFFGTDAFTYRASDGVEESAETTVTIEVTRVNLPPVAVADSYEIDSRATYSVDAASGVLANDTAMGVPPLTAGLVQDAALGVLALSPNGAFAYTPADGFVIEDSFSYRVSGNEDDGNTATGSMRAVPDGSTIPTAATATASIDEAANYTVCMTF